MWETTNSNPPVPIKLSSQSTAGNGLFEPFDSLSKHHVQKCWVKTILLSQTNMFWLFFIQNLLHHLLLVLTQELWSWEAKLSEGENTWLEICRGRVEDVNIGGEKLGHREIEVCRRFVHECAICCCRRNCRIYPWNNVLCSWNLLSRFNIVHIVFHLLCKNLVLEAIFQCSLPGWFETLAVGKAKEQGFPEMRAHFPRH